MTLQNIFSIKDHEGKKWIFLDDFISAVWNGEKHNIPRYRLSYLIKRTLASKCMKIDGKLAVPVLFILEFIFGHHEKYTLCTELAKEVESLFASCTSTYTTESSAETVYDLYRSIAKATFANNELSKIVQAKLNYDEHKIRTLLDIHKPQFTNDEWKHICAFEVQFGLSYGDVEDVTPETATKARWQFYEECQKASSLGQMIHKESKKCITRRNRRTEIAEVTERVKVTAKHYHCPSVVEEHIYSTVERLYPDTVSVVVVVDRELSRQDNVLDVYVELEPGVSIQGTDLATQITRVACKILSLKHNVKCSEIVLCSMIHLNHSRRRTKLLDFDYETNYYKDISKIWLHVG